jgi:hypothetical protein
LTTPTLPLAGGCQCGRHRYTLAAPPRSLYACHCTACQRQSGSAFGQSMPVDRAEVTWQGPEPAVWSRRAASGRDVGALFCPGCGTRLAHVPERDPSVLNFKPGTLDDTAWLRPVAHLWLDSAQPWVRIPDDALQYRRQPDDFAPIAERFRSLFPHWG